MLAGFDAIWISPVVTNTPGGYHGYWAQDIYGINPHFGSAEDLRRLVNVSPVLLFSPSVTG